MKVEKLAILWDKFQYVADKKDSWRILRGENWKGDCDDYAITALWLLSNKSWIQLWANLIIGRAMLWLVISPKGEMHVRLRFGRKWTCNIWPAPSDSCGMRRVMPWLAPMVAVKLLWSAIIKETP